MAEETTKRKYDVPPTVDVNTVVADELMWIKERREKAGVLPGEPAIDRVGMSLSGGGVRSATFNLGVMQALQRYGVLKFVDYLSTVSGGGYIGSSLTWFKSRKPDEFPFGTKRSDYSAYGRVLNWLRTHGSYLNPGSGMTTWALIGAVLMGTIINLLIVAPLLLSITYWMSQPIPAVKNENAFMLMAFAGLGSLMLFLIIVSAMVTWFQFLAGTVWERRVRVVMGWLLKIAFALGVFGLIPQAYELLSKLPLLIRPYISASAVSAIGIALLRSAAGEKPSIWAPLLRYVSVLFIAYGVFLLFFHFAKGLEGPWSWWWVFVLFIMGGAVNINLTSMHRFYRNRLRDAFMPYNVGPGPNGFPNASEKQADVCLLKDLQPSDAPYPIINTNIQLVGSKDPKLAGRSGDSFILSPYYCGARCTGYRKTDQYNNGKMDLATACSVSGAAVDPNTYMTRSRAVAFLMTLLNLRLGYWAANPRSKIQLWSRFWPYDMLREMLGRLSERSRGIRLSDGGHFENLGLYELIQRRCKYIIVCDASADPDFNFSDLAKVTEMVRVDFGAKIEVEVDAIRPDPETGLSKIAYATGTVTYSSPDKVPAPILYIKTAVTRADSSRRALPNDLYSYKRMNPTYPDQSTANQFFDERQFEAYRELGYQLGRQVCGATDQKSIKEFFEAAEKHWRSVGKMEAAPGFEPGNKGFAERDDEKE
jgi:hypothetical protein